MAYQKVGIGSNANDGTGDTLRVGADKINENFEDLFAKINGVANSAINDGTALTSDVIVLRTTSETLTNKTITAPVLGGTTTTASGNLVVDPATQIVEVRGDGSSVEGQIQLNCHANTHGQTLKAQPHSAGITNTMLLPTGASSTLVSLVSADTLTNKTLTAPKIADGGFIADANGAEQVIFQTTASAVNEIEITNAATGGSAVVSTSTAPIIGASGETNVDLALLPKGTGITTIRSTGGTNNQGAIRLNCENNTHGQTLMSQPHSANDSSFFMLPKGSTANNDRTAPDVLLSGDKTVGTTEAVSTATALSLDTMISELTTAGSGLAMTLANGVVGQIKIITMVVDGGGTATLTPATFANGTTIAFDDVNDTVMLLYANTIGWVVISNSGATVS